MTTYVIKYMRFFKLNMRLKEFNGTYFQFSKLRGTKFSKHTLFISKLEISSSRTMQYNGLIIIDSHKPCVVFLEVLQNEISQVKEHF